MIARILAALADSMEIPAAAGESVLGTIKIAVMPIAKVFTMCFLGLLMASKYVNILPPSGRKLLNGVIYSDFCQHLATPTPSQTFVYSFLFIQLVFSLLLPCLIFSQLGQAVTLHKMLQWFVSLISLRPCP